MIIGVYNRAGAVTFAGLVLAVAAVFSAFHRNLPLAMICLMYSGLCDLFDGWVARRWNRSETDRLFGLQIDSLADMAAFGLTPAVILLNSGFDGWIDFFLFSFYVCAAAMRLAVFNQTRTGAQQPMKTYTGLPVTYAAMIFPLALLAGNRASTWGFVWMVRAVVLVTAALFVLKVPVPKPRGRAYVFFTLLALGLTVLWLAKA